MNSFDIFDTLIGRNYFYIDSIFREMEDEHDVYPNFTYLRIKAEFEAETKTLDGIYKKFIEITGVDESTAEKLKNMEINLEYSRTFPIMTLLSKLTRDSLLISDSYYTKEQLEKLLAVNGITRDKYSDIICSYDGKSSGTVWSKVHPDEHIGDNVQSDFVIPRAHGVNSKHFSYSSFNEIEEKLSTSGLHKLAALCRRLRLANAFYEDETTTRLWEDQADLNVPILILTSIHLYYVYGALGYKILFSERDCHLLKKFYVALFGEENVETFYVSRSAYENASDSFIEYVKSVYVDGHTVIVDLQGTGKTATKFFKEKLEVTPLLFNLVYSDLNNEVYTDSFVHRKNGFSDAIERLNYSSEGTVLDFVDGKPVRSEPNNNKFILLQTFVPTMALSLLSKNFKVEKELINSIQYLIEYLLKRAENCAISKLVNHEEI